MAKMEKKVKLLIKKIKKILNVIIILVMLLFLGQPIILSNSNKKLIKKLSKNNLNNAPVITVLKDQQILPISKKGNIRRDEGILNAIQIVPPSFISEEIKYDGKGKEIKEKPKKFNVTNQSEENYLGASIESETETETENKNKSKDNSNIEGDANNRNNNEYDNYNNNSDIIINLSSSSNEDENLDEDKIKNKDKYINMIIKDKNLVKIKNSNNYISDIENKFENVNQILKQKKNEEMQYKVEKVDFVKQGKLELEILENELEQELEKELEVSGDEGETKLTDNELEEEVLEEINDTLELDSSEDDSEDNMTPNNKRKMDQDLGSSKKSKPDVYDGPISLSKLTGNEEEEEESIESSSSDEEN